MTRNFRKISQVLRSKSTLEGAGVRLKRAFGFNEVPLLDPFLLLDHFGSENPADYMAGFPWHPHRGIETVTYMHGGQVDHGDSLGNGGTINSGDVQWMTAGSGIIHQEMPRRWEGRMQGFQLWVNLPAARKMMDPRYRDVRKDQIVAAVPGPGIQVKVIAGRIAGMEGPVRDIVVPISYFDVSLEPRSRFRHPLPGDWKSFAYIYSGVGSFAPDSKRMIKTGELVLFGEGDEVEVRTDDGEVRFLLVSGQPLNEPVAWGGPIVMNTRAELERAFAEYRGGTFIRNR